MSSFFEAQARDLCTQWHADPRDTDSSIPFASVPVIPTGEDHPAAVAPVKPPVITGDALAHEVHRAYCEKCGGIDFEPFRDEWLAAAKLVQKLGAEPDVFVEAQLSRRVALDPEDLSGSTAASTYRTFMAERDQDILGNFVYSDNLFRSLMARELKDCSPSGVLAFPMISMPAAFRVFAAIRYCQNEDDILKIAQLYGELALTEFWCSPSLQAYLKHEWGCDTTNIIAWLSAVVQVEKQVDDDIERGRREAALREPAPGGAA